MSPEHAPAPVTAMRRVAVTGLGAVSCFGWGRDALWRGLLAGATGIGAIHLFDVSRHRTRLAGEVEPGAAPRLDEWFAPAARARLTRTDRFALGAAIEALRAADLDVPCSPATSMGLFFGSSTGGMFEAERFYRQLLEHTSGARPLDVRALAAEPHNAAGDLVARVLGCTGPLVTVSAACTASTMALAQAWESIRTGEVDVALAGGADALCELTHAGFNALRAIDTEPCRPFRRERAGLSIGEGGAMLVLESFEHARGRGVEPDIELAGAWATCDAYHMTAPEPAGSGAATAMEGALGASGLEAASIDFVNAHGTGTPHNDAAEWRALEAVFGDHASRIPITSTKGACGHLLGAAGALEAVVTVLCLVGGQVHATPGGGDVDPALAVDLVVGEPRPLARARAALSVNLAFGGANGALVFARTGRGAGAQT